MRKTVSVYLKNYLGTFAILALFLLMYHYATQHDLIDTILFPDIDRIAASFMKNYPTLLLGVVHSFGLLIPGFILGILVAFILGIPMGLSRLFRNNINPIVYSVSVIPPILMTPFAIHIFSSFSKASVFLIFYSTVWPTLFATINGVMTIDKRYLDNAATLEITGFKRMIYVIFPSAMPSIFAGIVTSLRGSFIILVYAEMFGVKYGMGYFVQYYSDLGRYDNVMSGRGSLCIWVTRRLYKYLIFDRHRKIITRAHTKPRSSA